MAITSARMQMKRGEEAYFDPYKMLPGEWAVSTDKKIVRMCIYPGLCLRMATYEAFEEDMKQIQTILTEARTIQEAVTRINTEVSANAKAVAEYTSQAKQYRDEAENFKNQASAIVGVDIATEDVFGLMAGGDNAVENGILTLTKTTKDRTLYKSKAGGLKINSIEGESQQDGTPSPDAEAKINSVVVSEIKGVGKNLYDNIGNFIGNAYSGVDVSRGEDDTFDIKGTATANVNVVQKPFSLPVGKYIISRKISGGMSIALYNRTKTNFIIYNLSTTGTEFKITDENDILDIRLQGITGGVYNVTGQAIMIRSADVEDNTYEPYHESKITLSEPITLRGIGDAKDKVNNENGSVYRKWHEFTLRASHIKSVTDGGGSTQMFVVTLPYNNVESSTSKLQILCSHYTFCDWNSNPWFVDNSISYYQYNTIRIKDSNYATIDEFKAFVESKYESGNPIMIMYRIATTAEPLPTADQIALHQLETYDTVTYISTDSTIEPIIEVEYGTSKTGAYALKAMLGEEANKLRYEQLNTLVSALATQLVAGSEV